MARSVEGAQQMGALVWPFTFVSSAFVPAQSMPGCLQGFANNQPVTQAIDATRTLLLGQPPGRMGPGSRLLSIPTAGHMYQCGFMPIRGAGSAASSAPKSRTHGSGPALLPSLPRNFPASSRSEREPSARDIRDEQLKEQIMRVWENRRKGRLLYGTLQVWLELRRGGVEVARCTVERLMRELGIAGAVAGRKKPRTTGLHCADAQSPLACPGGSPPPVPR